MPILFAFTEMSLSGGNKQGVHSGTVLHFFHSNRVINIFSPGEVVTRLFGVRSRSHASPFAAFTLIPPHLCIYSATVLNFTGYILH